MGMTVIDWWGVTARPKNAMVMRDIDAQGFFDLITRGDRPVGVVDIIGRRLHKEGETVFRNARP